jgi:uncharacterized protein YcaQ
VFGWRTRQARHLGSILERDTGHLLRVKWKRRRQRALTRWFADFPEEAAQARRIRERQHPSRSGAFHTKGVQGSAWDKNERTSFGGNVLRSIQNEGE